MNTTSVTGSSTAVLWLSVVATVASTKPAQVSSVARTPRPPTSSRTMHSSATAAKNVSIAYMRPCWAYQTCSGETACSPATSRPSPRPPISRPTRYRTGTVAAESTADRLRSAISPLDGSIQKCSSV